MHIFIFFLHILRVQCTYIATNIVNSIMHPKKIPHRIDIYIYVIYNLTYTAAKLQIFHMYKTLFRSQCPERRMNG